MAIRARGRGWVQTGVGLVSPGEERDFLLSYVAQDKDWAEWLAWQLESAGYSTLIKAWDLVPGSNWSAHTNAGITRTRRTIVVLSATHLRSLDGSPEWQAVVAMNPSGSERRLLPIRVEECRVSGLLATYLPIDLFGLGFEAARETLLQQVGHAVDGRAKPTVEPAFPRRIPGLAMRPEPAFPAAAPDRTAVTPDRTSPERTSPERPQRTTAPGHRGGSTTRRRGIPDKCEAGRPAGNGDGGRGAHQRSLRAGRPAVPSPPVVQETPAARMSWEALPTTRMILLQATTDAAVRRALDPLPEDAPAAVAYRPPAHTSMSAQRQALLDELESLAMAMVPAWLSGSEALGSAGASASAAIRRLAASAADAHGGSGPYVAALAEQALLGGSRSRTIRFPLDVRAAGVTRAISAAFDRTGLALIVDPATQPQPAGQRALLHALEWFAYQGRAGVWLTGPPVAAHADRIRVLACPVSPGQRLPSRGDPADVPTRGANADADIGADTESRPAASSPGIPPPATTPAVRGRPHPASLAEQRLERMLSRQSWAHGRAWNQPHRPGALSSLIYVDLAWFVERVIVEVDGPEHRAMAHYARDRWRDNELGLEGFTVLRFVNEAVLGDVETVVEQIKRCVTARRTTPKEKVNP